MTPVQTVYLRIRWGLERVMALLLLVGLSPLLLIVATFIKIRMGSPILFRQERVGIHGAPFQIVKFRTMVNNAEQLGGGYIPQDLNLIPPLGVFMRKSSLDELPQLINILRGEMSFIGPRPTLPDQVARYTDEQKKRLQIRPGVTGLAQVRYRNNAPWSVRIQSDLEYIQNVGLFVDLKIIGLTMKKVLGGGDVNLAQTKDEVDDLGKESGT